MDYLIFSFLAYSLTRISIIAAWLTPCFSAIFFRRTLHSSDSLKVFDFFAINTCIVLTLLLPLYNKRNANIYIKMEEVLITISIAAVWAMAGLVCLAGTIITITGKPITLPSWRMLEWLRSVAEFKI